LGTERPGSGPKVARAPERASEPITSTFQPTPTNLVNARRASLFWFSESVSSPEIKNISLFPKGKSGLYPHPSRPAQRGVGHRHNEGRGAVDAEAATDERGGRVRQRRVVLTSRCWRQYTWRQLLSGRYGGKRAVLRGEHVISRKAIAQGMSDVLRCPVCSCAHSLCTLRMRPRVQRASGIPCAL
jgi:hypothetical protein